MFVFVFMNTSYRITDRVKFVLLFITVYFYQCTIIAAPHVALVIFREALYIDDPVIKKFKTFFLPVEYIQCSVIGSACPQSFHFVFIHQPCIVFLLVSKRINAFPMF